MPKILFTRFVFYCWCCFSFSFSFCFFSSPSQRKLLPIAQNSKLWQCELCHSLSLRMCMRVCVCASGKAARDRWRSPDSAWLLSVLWGSLALAKTTTALKVIARGALTAAAAATMHTHSHTRTACGTCVIVQLN